VQRKKNAVFLNKLIVTHCDSTY